MDVADQTLDAELDGLVPGTALYLGWGSGTNGLKLARRGWSVTGVDWAEDAIKVATQAATDQGLDATYICRSSNYQGDVDYVQPL